MKSIDTKIELLLKGLNISKDFEYFDSSLDSALEDVYGQLCGEEELEIAKNMNGYPKRYHTTWAWPLRNTFDESGYSNQKIAEIIKKVISQRHKDFLHLYLIEKSLKDGDIELAKELLMELPVEGDYSVRANGYLHLLKHYASLGDIENFNNTLKLCNKKQRQDIFHAKAILINSLSRIKGFDYTFQIVSKKDYGEKFYFALLEPLATSYEVEDFEKLFVSQPAFHNIHMGMRINLYVKSLVEKQKLAFSEERFNKVFDLVMTIDPKEKGGDWRLRDIYLFDMAVSCGNLEVIEKCKKNLISPKVKKELNAYIKKLKAND
ncbi:MAG: hypothetical protein JSR97_10420 [Verrucomicrobia bacterium]|nr:hypothetical protein [Verrucomicrobiota bacterium]